MRIGIISDIHGNSFGLSAVLADLDKQGVDCVVGAGDLVGYYPYVNEVFELIRLREMTWILGNHECYLLGKLTVTPERWLSYNLNYVDRVIDVDHRKWLSQLPTERYLEFNGTRWILCHGSPWAVEEYVYPNYNHFERFNGLEVDVIVMGHTHVPMTRQMGKVLLINPGSCGQPRDGNPSAAYALVDTETHRVEIRRIAYDVEPIRHRILVEGFNPKLAKFLCRRMDEKQS
jgi:putative phosphoesterase